MSTCKESSITDRKDLKPGVFYKSANGNPFGLLNSFGLGELFAYQTNHARFVTVQMKGKLILTTIEMIKMPATVIGGVRGKI